MDGSTRTVVISCGAVTPEAQAAVQALAADGGAGSVAHLSVTSPDRLFNEWQAQGLGSHIAGLLADVSRDAKLVTVIDAHPYSLAGFGAVQASGDPRPSLLPR